MDEITSSSTQPQISISPEFYHLLKEYTGSNDPLEDPNFDIAAYLNEKFPDFKSLDKLPSLIEDFEKQIGELDEEIDNLMCERAMYNDEMKTYMTELNNDVGKIIELINNIKQNTDTNETTVKMICNDIKNLDNARNNITTTISSLTKLIMLITGIEKLESFVKEKQFKEAANAIAASNDIMEYFKEYRHVSQVNSLYQKKDNLSSVLLGAILDEFKSFIDLLPNNSERLYDACLAINAMGDNAIRELKSWFTSFKLDPYEKTFDPHAPSPVEFSETERRFEWIKRTLQEYDKIYNDIFPPSWGFKSQLCQDFCRITKIHLNDILAMNSEGVKKIDVEILVKVLNNTIKFEKNLNEYLLLEFPTNNNNSNGKAGVINITSNITANSTEKQAAEIRAKYGEKTERNPNRKDPNIEAKYQLFRVLGVISESFEPFMWSYVYNEEKKIKESIASDQQTDHPEGKYYISSMHLFNNIKHAMTRCLTISKGKTFNDLCLKFRDILKYYNENFLRNKLPLLSNITANNNSNNLILTSSSFVGGNGSNNNQRLKDNEIAIISYVINTCDYCITTIATFTQSVKEKIDEKYKDGISYDDVIENLREIYKNAFELLSLNLRNIINEQLASGLSKINWLMNNNHDESGFDVSSAFVFSVKKTIESIFTVMSDKMQEEFLCHFLNIIPKLLTEAMISSIYKVKKIDETGAQKLQTDAYEISDMILKIYCMVIKLAPGQNKENDSRYCCLKKIVKKEFDRLDTRLICLGSPVGEIGNAYKTVVKDKSKEDFDKLLLIRNIKKNEIPDYDKIVN